MAADRSRWRSELKRQLKLGQEKIQNLAEKNRARRKARTCGDNLVTSCMYRKYCLKLKKCRDQPQLNPLLQGLLFPHRSHQSQPTLFQPHRYNNYQFLGRIIHGLHRPKIRRPTSNFKKEKPK